MSRRIILQKELDTEQIFHLPVAVAYPDIAQAYQKTVAYPMDLRTIMEDRVHRYRSIRELQQDLLLVFDNCIAFNEDGSVLHDTAATMIDVMDVTFEGVCEDLKIRCLRHK
jgi:Bromodomain